MFSSALALTIAFVAEFFFYFPPCQLCNYQRLVYLFLLVGAMLYLPKKKIYLIVLPVVALFVVSVFQVGVEQRIWQYESTCTTNIIDKLDTMSPEDFQKMILSRDVTMCDQPKDIAFGVTFSVLSLFYATILLILVITAVRYRYETKN
jgi:disulfide bond formation protein DsbB